MKLPIKLQLSWISMSILWNISGIILVSQGKRALGPTASWTAIAILLLLAIVLVISYQKKWAIFYFLLTFLGGAMAFIAVRNAFVQDILLWPSEFWRYAGIVVNSFGIFAGFFAILRIKFKN
jgi:hypothetical protein